MHLGALLPNFDRDSSPEAVGKIAAAAERLGFDSVWVTEHILVPPEIEVPYGRVFEPLLTLAWVAPQTRRVQLGISVIVVPMHNPIHLAKEAATLQILSGGRLALGVGAGWLEKEFRFLGLPFADRGARLDESLRLMRALWSGEQSFQGKFWSFEDARFGPLPEPAPELWMGGVAAPTIRRARELGAVWHPNWVQPTDIRAVVAQTPGLRVIPRIELGLEGAPPRTDFTSRHRPILGDAATVATRLREYLDAGVAGFVLGFGTHEPDLVVERMAYFLDKVRPMLP